MQAAANFQEELRAMRRAFRYSPLLAPPAEGRDAGPLAKV